MQLLENLITEDEIQILRNYWEKNNQNAYINRYSEDNSDEDVVIDKRLLIIPGTEAYTVMRRVVDAHFPKDSPIWANYQRQTNPHKIHMDEYGKDRTNPTWTIVIALDTIPKFKTIVFKEQSNTCAGIADLVHDIIQVKKSPKVSNISETEDLDHTIYDVTEGTNTADWLTPDGVFTYKAGDGCLFDTNQLHVTSYWTKYPEYTYRDLVQIHIGTPAATSYDEEEQKEKGVIIPSFDSMAKVIKE